MAKLFVTGLPIDDRWKELDPRVIRAVAECGLVVAEEKKSALRLLAAAGAREKPFILINEHSTDIERAETVDKIQSSGITVFVSDAGTPSIADPDYRLVDLCIKAGVEVMSVPGPSSITSALSVSGFKSDRFIFLGFPPKERAERKKFFDNLAKQTITAVFLERPYALKQTLQDLAGLKREISLSVALGTESEKNIRGAVNDVAGQAEGIKEPFAVVVRGTD